jgi:hypothetical protein
MQHHKINWTSATVKDGRLTVSVGTDDPKQARPSGRWESIFRIVAQQNIPGVQYSMSFGWGSVDTNHGQITVASVTDRVVGSLRAHLDAAVVATDQEDERQHQELEREALARQEQARKTASQDADMTERFRQFGE